MLRLRAHYTGEREIALGNGRIFVLRGWMETGSGRTLQEINEL